MTTGTIYFNFSADQAELVQSGENRADGAIDPWAGADRDGAWQAEQSEFLQMAARADAEAVFSDE